MRTVLQRKPGYKPFKGKDRRFAKAQREFLDSHINTDIKFSYYKSI